MNIEDYIKNDLQNDIELIFVNMMDNGFRIITEFKNDLLRISITKGNELFNIGYYKEYILQLFDVLNRRGLQLFNSIIGTQQNYVNSIESILDGSYFIDAGTNFIGKSDKFWDALMFNIYMTDKDSIINLSLFFCKI